MNWRDDPARRWGVAIIVSSAGVAVLALVMKQFMEGVVGIGYTIHWFETVPLIVLLFAFFLQRGWKSDAEAVVLESRDAEE